MTTNLHLEVFAHEVPQKKRTLVKEPVNFDLIDKNKYANNAAFAPDSVYRRLLNEVTNFQWSFLPHKIEEVEDKNGKHIRFIGLLVVPGFGVHTGIGSQALNKKDNTNALAAAKTYAFKNACKEMGLAPNIGDEKFEDDLFENDVEEEDDVMDFSEEDEEPEEPKKKPKAKDNGNTKPKTKPKKANSTEDRIKEIRGAYELDDDDEFVAFIQIWDEDILEVEDMEEDDWDEFFAYVEKNKSKFEDF